MSATIRVPIIAWIFAASMAFGPAACQVGSITADDQADDDTDNPDDPPDDPPNDPNDPSDDPDICVGDGSPGTDCEVTGDCAQPLVCLDGLCVGPSDPGVTCDQVEGIDCPEDDQVCVGRVCVVNPGECTTVDDCPLGYLCIEGQCLPDNGGEPCSDPGPGPALAGTWAMDSTLHLREGIPGIAAGFLDLSELLADFIEGNVDLGLPAPVEALIGYLIQSIIDEYVPNWAQQLIVTLAGVSDVLDDLQVDSTVDLTGQECDATYRGSEHWDWITFEYRGSVVTTHPEDIPEIGAVYPEEFGAMYSCGQLFIDRHRIKNVLSGLITWVVNTMVEITTGYDTVQEALDAALPCAQIADAINDAWQSACGCSTDVSAVAEATCDAYKDDLIDQVTTLLDNATVSLSVVSLKGIADIPDGNHMANGVWYGSVIGGDFPGEFTATR